MLPEIVCQHILERNQALHNRHAGERCFILATGPSIKEQDLKPLRNEVCMAVSNFFVHPDYALIAPRYHCMAAFCPPNTEEAWDAWMQSLDEALRTKNPHGELILPLRDIKRNGRVSSLADRPTYYLDMGAGEELLEIGVDLLRAIMPPQSVPIMALQAALYMGFKEIYLIGCDHDWILFEARHFYQENEHAVSRIIGANKSWEGVDIELMCRSYVCLWQQYKLLRQLAHNMGVSILNATKGGMLDVFPRVALESLTGQSGPGKQANLPDKDAFAA